MTRRRRTIEKRKRIFLGCEGESEQSYGVFLQKLADTQGLKVHIDAVNVQPAGDPLAVVQKSIRAFSKAEKKGRIAYKAVLLDADKLEEVPDNGRNAIAHLNKEGFTAIWQKPDHEGFLLRHFEGQQHADPPRGQSMARLQREWPNYHKNMPAIDLQKVLTLDQVLRAASVNPELLELLAVIGFPTA